jgi:guanylate kinase
LADSGYTQTRGKLIVVSAPSGAGKTTIVHYLMRKLPELEFSVSACSRAKRPNEKNGIDYYFLSIAEFKRKIENKEFIEWEEVYPDQFYGTLKSELERIWAKGHPVIFDVDVLGGINIKNLYGENCLAVFIMPPSIEELKKRLENRSTETEESLQKRLGKAKKEMTYAGSFDVVIINDKLEKAQKKAEAKIREFLEN